MIAVLEKLARRENVVAVIVSVIVFGVYFTTMCPTVSFTDSGELATVATTLGVAHPTGYPLWTLIGRLAVMVPVASQEIERLNVLGSILTALAVGFFFKLVLVLYRSTHVFQFNPDSQRLIAGWIPMLSGFVTALIVGFSSTVWAQSVEIEVYALHVLLIVIVTLFFVSGIEIQLTNPRQVSRGLLLFAFTLGLSFANHMTTILLAPGFLYLFFVAFGFKRKSWKLISLLVPFFILGLSAYIYLPVRSSAGTLMDWGHPVTFERFWWHFSGKQYQTWMFAGSAVAQKQFGYFLSNFSTEFNWIVIAVLAVGFLEALNLSKRLIAFLLILFVSCLAYSVNFDIHEIDPYFMLAYLSCGCFVGIGIVTLLRWSRHQRSKLRGAAIIAFLLTLPVIQYCENRGDVDQSKNFLVHDFVNDVFAQVEPRAVVFSSLWDYLISPSYYYQVVRKERPDVIFIDRELLQNRTWYFIQLGRRYPEIVSASRKDIDLFLTELNKFERGEPFDYVTIKSRWDYLLEDMVNKLMAEHPVYVDPRIVDEFPQEFERVPEGLLVRLVKKGEKGQWKPILGQFKQGLFSNYVSNDLKRYFAAMYTYHSLYLLNQKRLAEGLHYLQQALTTDPSFPPALNLKAQLSGLVR